MALPVLNRLFFGSSLWEVPFVILAKADLNTQKNDTKPNLRKYQTLNDPVTGLRSDLLVKWLNHNSSVRIANINGNDITIALHREV